MSKRVDPLLAYRLQWVPGQGPSDTALKSLRQYLSPQPYDPPGEAWFMGKERKMFTKFIQLPIEEIPIQELQDFISEAASGLDCFPEAVEEVALWTEWFEYMLPCLVSRARILEKSGPDLSNESMKQFFNSIRKYISFDLLLSWLDQFSKYDELSSLISIHSIAGYVNDKILLPVGE